MIDAFLLSVVVPCFNKGAEIKRTLDSILSAGLIHYEVLVLDDASTDSSKEVIENVACKNSEIRTVFSKKNRGVSRTRNLGIKLAKGRYLFFLDGDDSFLPEIGALLSRITTAGVLDLLTVQGFWRHSKKVRPRAIGFFSNSVKRLGDYEYKVIHPIRFIEETIPFGGSQVLVKRECIHHIRFVSGEFAFEDFLFYFQIIKNKVCWHHWQKPMVCFDDQPNIVSLSRKPLSLNEIKKPIAIIQAPSEKIARHVAGVWVLNSLLRLTAKDGLSFILKFPHIVYSALFTRYGIPALCLWIMRLGKGRK